MLQHLARDMAGDIHYRLVTGAAFREFGDEGVSRVMESSLDPRAVARIDPSGLQRGDRPSRIEMIGLSEGKQIPFGVDSAEAQFVPFGMSFERPSAPWPFIADMDSSRSVPVAGPPSNIGWRVISRRAFVECGRTEASVSRQSGPTMGHRATVSWSRQTESLSTRALKAASKFLFAR